MHPWAIFYAAGSVVRGTTPDDWSRAPTDGVLHVTCEDGHGNGSMYEGEDGRNVSVTERSVWTGTEDFDPFGWGPKSGVLVDDATYWRTYREACRGEY